MSLADEAEASRLALAVHATLGSTCRAIAFALHKTFSTFGNESRSRANDPTGLQRTSDSWPSRSMRSEWVYELLQLGVSHLGESRPQQLVKRASLLPGDVHWHFIGHLQRNKVAQVLPCAELIHSVDSLRLLERIDLLAQDAGVTPRVLIEVNVSGESAKQGFLPQALRDAWENVFSYRHVRVDGLMTLAPETTDRDRQLSVFHGLRELRDQLHERSPSELTLAELSMGMSGDFEPAIEAGATIVRIGSALFEGLSE